MMHSEFLLRNAAEIAGMVTQFVVIQMCNLLMQGGRSVAEVLRYKPVNRQRDIPATLLQILLKFFAIHFFKSVIKSLKLFLFF